MIKIVEAATTTIIVVGLVIILAGCGGQRMRNIKSGVVTQSGLMNF